MALSVPSLAAVIDALEPAGDGWTGSVPPGWQQGRTAYGGFSTALALVAAMRVEPDLPPLRSAQIAFVGPLSGRITIRAERLRRGRNAAFVRAEVSGEAGVGLSATFVFMAPLASSVSWSNGTAPALPPPSPGDATSFGLPGIAFTERFEMLDAPRDGLASAEWLRWVRLRDRDRLDPMVAFVALADALPPAALALVDGPAPISSMTWLLNLLRLPETEDGWFLLRAATDHAADGASSQHMQAWDTRGAQVAEHMQSVAIFA